MPTTLDYSGFESGVPTEMKEVVSRATYSALV